MSDIPRYQIRFAFVPLTPGLHNDLIKNSILWVGQKLICNGSIQIDASFYQVIDQIVHRTGVKPEFSAVQNVTVFCNDCIV